MRVFAVILRQHADDLGEFGDRFFVSRVQAGAAIEQVGDMRAFATARTHRSLDKDARIFASVQGIGRIVSQDASVSSAANK
jgi:hypothetical protein